MNAQNKKREVPVRKTPRKRYVRLQSSLTLEDLKRFEAEEARSTEQPDTLPLKDIHVAPFVFQWRLENDERAAEEQLMKDLVRFIEGDEPPRALDAIILVTAIGKRVFVLDGHHRLDAYHTAKWMGRVPVKHFNGSLKEAEALALRLNVKNKLPMTQDAKSEAAWRMLVAGLNDHTWRRTHEEIMRATTASRTNIKRMARALRALGDRAIHMSWADVRKKLRSQQQDEMDEADRRDWKEEKARELADYLMKGPTNLIRDPEITARALTMVSSLLPSLLVGEWPEEARESLLVAIEECVPNRAEAVREALDALEHPAVGRQRPLPEVDVANLPDTAKRNDFDSL